MYGSNWKAWRQKWNVECWQNKHVWWDDAKLANCAYSIMLYYAAYHTSPVALFHSLELLVMDFTNELLWNHYSIEESILQNKVVFNDQNRLFGRYLAFACRVSVGSSRAIKEMNRSNVECNPITRFDSNDAIQQIYCRGLREAVMSSDEQWWTVMSSARQSNPPYS